MYNSPSSSIVGFSFEVVALCRPIVEAVQRKDRDLASQLRRAISSISLNLAEGFGAARGNSRLRFETALGSLNEAQAGIQVALAWGYVSNAAVTEALTAISRLGGRIAGLVRR